MKKLLILFLPLIMTFLLAACANDEAAQNNETKLSDESILDTSKITDDSSEESSESEETPSPVKSSETGFRFIDNANLPDYAREFYEVLEESTDNDKEKDYLIDDQYFTAGDVTSEHLIDLLTPDREPYQITHDKDRTCMYIMKSSDEEAETVVNNLRTAYDMFQTDHPEVFWLTSNEPDFIYSTVKDENGQERYFFMVLKFFNDSLYDIHRGYTENRIKDDISKLNQSVENILAGMPEGNVYEKVKYFNDWLVKHNSYKYDGSAEEKKTAAENSKNSISALLGSVGEDGPDCRGYAFAFKVLCDRAQIPCITAISENPYYVWNYVQGEQLWYGVDITWNDPRVFDQNGNRIAEAAESGYENDEFLMCGTDTTSETDNKHRTFHDSSHSEETLRYPLPQHIKISKDEYSH